MTHRPPAAAAAALLAALLGGCAALPIPRIGGADESIPRLVENRAWIEEGSPVPGSLRVWLGPGEMLLASCWEVPRLAAWRWTGTASLEWTDGGARSRAEVAAVGPDELVLLVEDALGSRTVSYRAAGSRPPC